MRGFLLVGLYACDAPQEEALWRVGATYVQDPAVGRAALEAAIVDSSNDYSRLRLENYRPERWGALPEYRPRAARVYPGKAPEDFWEAPTALPESAEAWRALGERAFFTWPTQIELALGEAVQDPQRAEAAGLVPDGTGALPLVWVEVPGGRALAYSCATCHGAPDGQARFDVTALHTGHASAGAGRVDVTADGLDNATAITDLRPIRRQTHLHRAATLRNGLLSLAVRIETLLITGSGQNTRPPRIISFALAWYLWSLADEQPPLPKGLGAAVFARVCSGCHQGEDLTGPPVPLVVVGTPDAVGRSPDRGTGFWRVPSLRGVGSRAPLLASGLIPNLQTLLDPEREVPGHRFGFELSAAERSDLLAWLQQL